MQLAFTASVDPQSVVRAKSPASLPASAIELIDSGAVPGLLTVTVAAELVEPTSREPKATVPG